jgi:hypothetical protein
MHNSRVEDAGRIGCIGIALPVAIVLSPVVLIMLLWEDYRTTRMMLRFRRKHGAKVGILVYSDSPNWQTYIEDNWLRSFGDKFVVMNWSERKQWPKMHPLESSIYARYAGARAYNPIAIVFAQKGGGFHALRAWTGAVRRLDPWAMLAPSPRSVSVIRFWQPFRDYKHGKRDSLQLAEAELTKALETEGS